MMRFRSVFLGLALVVGTVASAQMPPGFKMPSLRYNPALLMNPDVQKDMHLSPEVGQKVQGVIMSEGMKILPLIMGGMNGKKSPPTDQKKMMAEIMAANDRMQSETLKLLSPPQRVRLHEITLQQSGATALLDPKVAAELGLTATQSTQLQQALTKSSRSSMAGMGSMKGGLGSMGSNPAAMQSFAAKAAASAKRAHVEGETALNGILTPSQRIKWKHLQGRHIELKGMAGMGGMFGGM